MTAYNFGLLLQLLLIGPRAGMVHTPKYTIHLINHPKQAFRIACCKEPHVAHLLEL